MNHDWRIVLSGYIAAVADPATLSAVGSIPANGKTLQDLQIVILGLSAFCVGFDVWF